MENKFTGKAQHALTLAVEHAQALGNTYISSEHILLGLLAESGGMAHTALTARKVTYNEVETVIKSSIGIARNRA